MSRSSVATVDRGALKLISCLVAVAALALALVALVPGSGPAFAGGGNNGTVKVAELGDMDDPPDNDPHVGCTFNVEWYNFDPGTNTSTVTFESQAPTAGAVISGNSPTSVQFTGGQGFDFRQPYTLSFQGTPQPNQGFHVKLTVNTPGSKGADKKSKVFWVKGCQAPPPTTPAIHLEKTVTDADGDGIARSGELLTYTMTVTNVGNAVLHNVTITDTKLGLTAAACVAILDIGASATCPTATYTVTDTDVAAGSVHNVATVTGTPPTGPPVTDDDDATIPTAAGPPGAPDLALTKTADKTVVKAGSHVTYTLTATNSGTGTALDVVVTDKLPTGTSFYSSSPGCTHVGSTVTCRLGDIAPGDDAFATITVKVSKHLHFTTVTSHDHQIGVTKIESHLSVQGGDVGSATTQCPAGYFATDGSVRIDSVDQDAGTYDDVMVLQSQATDDGRGWTGIVLNDTTGQLQAKVNVVCMSDRTVSGENHSHPVVVSAPVTQTVSGDADHSYPVDLTCTEPTAIAITPGFSFASGNGVVNSQPFAGEGGRHFWVNFQDGGDVTLTIRCLSTELGSAAGHTHQLVVAELSDSVVVNRGETVERSLTCPVGYKGIVAWVIFDGVSLGNDPQPITRVFRFYNPTDQPLTARYGLTCIDVRTAGGNQASKTIVNTATVTPTDATPADNTASATITVRRNRAGRSLR